MALVLIRPFLACMVLHTESILVLKKPPLKSDSPLFNLQTQHGLFCSLKEFIMLTSLYMLLLDSLYEA